MLLKQKIEGRVEESAIATSLSAIAVLISKYVTTVEDKSPTDEECFRMAEDLTKEKLGRQIFTIWGSANGNGNESING